MAHSTPKAWRICRSGAAAASMKDGAIGRGRGAMSAEQFEQAQRQIEENKAGVLQCVAVCCSVLQCIVVCFAMSGEQFAQAQRQIEENRAGAE